MENPELLKLALGRLRVLLNQIQNKIFEVPIDYGKTLLALLSRESQRPKATENFDALCECLAGCELLV